MLIKISELLSVFPDAEAYLEDRQKTLKDVLDSKTKLIKERQDYNRQNRQDFERWFFDLFIEVFLKKDTKKLEREIKRNDWILNPIKKGNGITEQDIEIAKAYPLMDLIGTDKTIINCPNPDHEDKNPSCSINKKANFLYCFSCNYYADSIKYVQDNLGLGFVDAVRRLI